MNILNINGVFKESGLITIDDVITNEQLEVAYAWLCAQRKEHSHNNSIWHLRHHWVKQKEEIKEQLLCGTYRLKPLTVYTINKDIVSSWEACDALVLKAISLTLAPLFTKEHYPECTHIKDAGGIHGALAKVQGATTQYAHLLKSDVHSYYDSIDHEVLFKQLRQFIHCSVLLDLIKQYCVRTEIRNGLYYTITKGIPKGCPLSPQMAALYLKPLDDALKNHGFHVRFMDDWSFWSAPKSKYVKWYG